MKSTNLTIPIETEFLKKVASFITLALSEVKTSKVKLAAFKEKESQEKATYNKAIRKVAQVLYDTDFITDDEERNLFIKKATNNPLFVVQKLEQVCNAADVSLIGKPARVAAKTATTDPIYNKAFGYNQLLDSYIEDSN